MHLAAYDGTTVVGSANVRPALPPFPSMLTAGSIWRLRGMAAEPTGRGIGALVLAAAVQQVAGAGGHLLWCNARVPAQAFYAREGWSAVGSAWEDPETGPHVVMQRAVTASTPRPGGPGSGRRVGP